MPVPTNGSLGPQERHRLTLHVGAHEGTVRVVMLQERNHRGGDGDHLARRDVDVVDLVTGHVVDLATLVAHQHPILDERRRSSVPSWPGR